MNDWITGGDDIYPDGATIEVEIEHCNTQLNMPNEFVRLIPKEDGFYFEDGSELSLSWNIKRWRKL